MKTLIPALLIVAAIPSGVFADSSKHARTHNSYGRHQQYSAIYDYDAARDENSIDHFVTQDDKRIAQEVRKLIDSANFQDPNDVQIFVEYGKVILEGKADSQANRQAAEDAVSRVHGVRNVVNGLYVDNRSAQKQRAGQGQTSGFPQNQMRK